MLAKSLGKRIAQLRKEAGLTQERFAEATGYSVEFVSLVERGVNSPTVAGLEIIAGVLQVKPRDLFDFDDSSK